MAAFFSRGELVLKVHASGPRFNHHFHEFVGVEVAAEAGFGIGHKGHQPIAGGALLRILRILDLVCPQKGRY
jgi:hypothetical protein